MVIDAPFSPRRPSAPLVLSGVACVLSACALVVALGAAPPRAAVPAATSDPAAATLSNTVTIAGLHIGAGQIDANAVESAALADGAVSSRAIADAAVTASKLSNDAIREVARGVTASVNLAGDVDEDGRVVRGKGFFVSRTGMGEYEISFHQPFLAPPVVVAAAQSYGVCYLPVASIGKASVRIKCLSDLLGTSPVPVNTRFTFVATPIF